MQTPLDSRGKSVRCRGAIEPEREIRCTSIDRSTVCHRSRESIGISVASDFQINLSRTRALRKRASQGERRDTSIFLSFSFTCPDTFLTVSCINIAFSPRSRLARFAHLFERTDSPAGDRNAFNFARAISPPQPSPSSRSLYVKERAVRRNIEVLTRLSISRNKARSKRH